MDGTPHDASGSPEEPVQRTPEAKPRFLSHRFLWQPDLIVFVSSACIMILELVAGRIIAPLCRSVALYLDQCDRRSAGRHQSGRLPSTSRRRSSSNPSAQRGSADPRLGCRPASLTVENAGSADPGRACKWSRNSALVY